MISLRIIFYRSLQQRGQNSSILEIHFHSFFEKLNFEFFLLYQRDSHTNFHYAYVYNSRCLHFAVLYELDQHQQ